MINAAAAQLADYFTGLAASRRADPRDDLLSDLLAVSDADAGRLASAELLHTLTMLLVAGFETSTNLLGNGLQVILHPTAGAALRDGSASPQAFVEEVLRFDAPIQYTMRTGHATSVGGVPVTGQTMLTVVLGAGNRDPRRFADPATFDPLRPVGGPLSFGGGAHFCIGAALARLEGAVAFPRLLNRLPDIAAAGEPVRQDRLFFLRGFDTLPVTIN